MVQVGAKKWEQKAAYDPRKTARYYFTARNRKNSFPLEDMIEVAHSLGVPVLVDAASEVPPKRKLGLYTKLGADLVAFSSGKHISGPNTSGFLVGRRDLIKLAHLQSYPFNGIGRSAKMSRESMVGLVEALRIYLDHDEQAVFDEWMKNAEYIMNEFKSLPSVETGITYQRAVEDGEPMAPFSYIRLNPTIAIIDGPELVTMMKDGDPVVYTIYEPTFMPENCQCMVMLSPEYLQAGEVEMVVEKVRHVLTDVRTR